MLAFLLRRAVVLVATLGLVSLVAFFIPYVGGGDPARTIIHARTAESAIDESTIQAVRQQLGLDKPLLYQYGYWVADALHGDLGYSFTDRTPVAWTLIRALGVSLTLAFTALMTAFLVSIPLGTAAALRQGKLLDNAITFVTQCFVAFPEAWPPPSGS